LNPAKIVVVGGSGVINSSVISTLRNYTSGSVIRLGGVDRYDTSRKIAPYAFGDREVTEAYVAAGTNFPDALSAAAAAAAAGRGAPVVIVPGTAANAGAATWALLVGFDLDDIYVEGGTGVVSSSMKSWLGGIAPTTRLSGSDRFSTSLAINKQAHASATGARLRHRRAPRLHGQLSRRLRRVRLVSLRIHLAALKQAGESVARPLWYLRPNLAPLAAVLEVMVQVGVRSVVFSSSAAVYGKADGAVSEDARTEPSNQRAGDSGRVGRLLGARRPLS
jgi:nucleoside-diphosphate-sugar epimerase